MNSRAPGKRLLPPSSNLISMLGDIVVPIDVFLYMSAFLTFTNYKSFIRAFWPAGDEDELLKKKLWEMSCHKLEATFCNGKSLEIEYNFDATREGRRVLIKVECLLPIFGGVSPSGLNEFESILELNKFIKDNVNLERCSSYRHASCPCHMGLNCKDFPRLFMEPPLSECEVGHFHHYCREHVISWLGNYLHTLILLRESKELFDQVIAEQYAFFSLATPQYLLESALNINTSYCEIAHYDDDD